MHLEMHDLTIHILPILRPLITILLPGLLALGAIHILNNLLYGLQDRYAETIAPPDPPHEPTDTPTHDPVLPEAPRYFETATLIECQYCGTIQNKLDENNQLIPNCTSCRGPLYNKEITT